MSLLSYKKLIQLTVLIVSLIFILKSVCLSSVMHKGFQYGFFKKPNVDGVSIVMGKGWYPAVSSKSILGFFVHDDYPYIMYKKNTGCFDDEGWILVSKIPKDSLDISKLNKKITSSHHYSWGDAEIVTGYKANQTIKEEPRKNMILVFIREYNLFITLDDLSYLEDIIELSSRDSV